MNIGIQQIVPFLTACVTTGGIIFQIGKQSEKLNIIGLKVEAQEKKENINNHTIFEILGTVNLLKNDTNNIKEDIKEIKEKIYKIK
tara:strand:+ start:232 stop:489 length:258 start_codon:yes stop_codon:yes gene_type:complete